MKIIKNGKTYNTDTATCLGTYCNGGQSVNYYGETLYRKRNGEYFLSREGGANTPLAQPCGPNEWTGGVQVDPLSEEEAMRWAEEHMAAEDYIALWGEPEE